MNLPSHARPGSAIAVRLENIAKSFGDQVAVRELSLTLGLGEIFAFLGPNGAGKTTTLKVTTGLLRPDTGAVHICGLSMEHQSL